MGRHVFTSSRGKGLDNRAAASLAGADAGGVEMLSLLRFLR